LLGAWGDNTCKAAAQASKNSLECLTYAHEYGAPWTKSVCSAAAEKSNLECLKYAHENGCDWAYDTCSIAARAGSLQCLTYAIENGNFTLKSDLYNSAALAGSLACMKYLHEKNCPVGLNICYDAIPHLDCLQYALEVLKAPLDRNIELKHAVLELSEECLKYLIDKGVTWPDCNQKWVYSMEEVFAENGDVFREIKLAVKYKCKILINCLENYYTNPSKVSLTNGFAPLLLVKTMCTY
jgi:hypothetical protein